jgi:hypothetical protein
MKPYIPAFLIGAWLPYIFNLWGGIEFPIIATMYVLSWEKLHE